MGRFGSGVQHRRPDGCRRGCGVILQLLHVDHRRHTLQARFGQGADSWGLIGHLPSQGCGPSCLWGGDGVGGPGSTVLHRFCHQHCAVSPLRNNFASRCRQRRSHGGRRRAVDQVGFGKRQRLGQEARLDGGRAGHGRMARHLGHRLVISAGRPHLFALQGLGDGRRGAGFVQVLVVSL